MTTKKLLPTVIGMILAGGAVATAQADVQIMGHIDESVAYSDRGNEKTPWPLVTKGDTNTQLVCTTCSVGVKGSEDLGNGLKALFFLDWQYDINGNDNTGSGGLTGRDQWLGLGGGFGTLKAGTMSTVYKSYGAMIDPAYRTIAQQRNIGLQSNLHNGKGVNGEGRATNTIGYNSPDWKGLSLDATYTLQNDNTTPTSNKPFSVGAKYENGGLLGYVTYINNGTGHDNAATAIGAKYTLDRFAVFGQYEFDQGLITDSVTGTLGQGNSGDGADVWTLGGTYTMGNNTLYAAYGASTGDASTTDTATGLKAQFPQYKAWELVGMHSFSKRTLAYAGYVGFDGDSDGASTVATYTIGMKHTF
jgi:predicted porin